VVHSDKGFSAAEKGEPAAAYARAAARTGCSAALSLQEARPARFHTSLRACRQPQFDAASNTTLGPPLTALGSAPSVLKTSTAGS
jgi:hypothetical protein